MNDTQHLSQAPTPAIWSKVDPPKDGTLIMAVGEVINMDPYWDVSDGLLASFRGAIRWSKDASGRQCWRYYGDGRAVADDPNDEVAIQLWTPVPWV